MEHRHPNEEVEGEESSRALLASLFRRLKRRRITFYVNEQSYERWYGATVEHAIIAYDQDVLKDIRAGKAWVADARGNRVGLGGTLEEGARLKIKFVNE